MNNETAFETTLPSSGDSAAVVKPVERSYRFKHTIITASNNRATHIAVFTSVNQAKHANRLTRFPVIEHNFKHAEGCVVEKVKS